MRLYFDRAGKYHGYSIGSGTAILGAVLVFAVLVAVSWRLILLAPFIGLWVLVVLAWRSEFRRFKARREAKAAKAQPRSRQVRGSQQRPTG